MNNETALSSVLVYEIRMIKLSGMDLQLIETLLYRGESEVLDFKVDKYSSSGAIDEDKAKLAG